MNARSLSVLLAGVMLLMPMATLAQSSACGTLANAYGPFDYRKERNGMLRIVEGAHFTPEVEMLVRGRSGYLGGDLDYTLRAAPNHHRALSSMARLAEREKSSQPSNMRYSVDCWFDRGIRFAPDDYVVRFLYAQYLRRNNRTAEAEAQLSAVQAANPREGLTWLNLALMLTDLARWPAARDAAERARSLGIERDPLTQRLAAAGHPMRDPENLAAAAAAASASAASAPSTPASSAASGAAP